MTVEDLITELKNLHAKVPNHIGHTVCNHCEALCHSYEGLQCDDVDGKWPCQTMAIVIAYETNT